MSSLSPTLPLNGAILRLSATYGAYQVRVTELISPDARQYRYYVLSGEFVVDWLKANVKPHGKGEGDWTSNSN